MTTKAEQHSLNTSLWLSKSGHAKPPEKAGPRMLQLRSSLSKHPPGMLPTNRPGGNARTLTLPLVGHEAIWMCL